jgi:hypothetical protein
MAHDNRHIPLSVLWEYATNPKPGALPSAEWDHLKACDECVNVLWLCNTSRSVDDVREKLRERGSSAD